MSLINMDYPIPPILARDSYIKKKILFIRQAHDSIGQIRKYSKAPYWTHTEWVASNIAQTYAPEFEYYAEVIIGAAGHDVKEDVQPKNPVYSDEYLIENLGLVAFEFIVELTDVYTKEAYPNFNRATRHNLENERIGGVSAIAKTIKCFDVIHNTSDILERDAGFGRKYLHEKLEQFKFLEGAVESVYEKLKNHLYGLAESHNISV